MTATTYTMMATAMKMCKTNGILLRNRQIHCEFTVIPSFRKRFVADMVVATMVIVCGCHCRTPNKVMLTQTWNIRIVTE